MTGNESLKILFNASDRLNNAFDMYHIDLLVTKRNFEY